MPSTNLVIYQEEDGTVPLRDWLDTLEEEPRTRCLARLTLLEQHGHELRRPHAENIGGGRYELRLKYRRVNLRMLYFFHGTTAAVVSHGFAKEREIPPSEITIAHARLVKFLKNPARHTFRQEP